MARPGQIDHVEVGLNQVPEKLRGERIQRYLGVYLKQFNDLEEAVQQLIEAFLAWETFGAQKDFVLNTIGSLLDQPRPEGFDNNAYSFILQARVLSRKSSATPPDVYRVANFLANGKEVRIFRAIPKILIVVFVDLQVTAQEKALYSRILLDSIDAVDQLEVQFVPSGTAFYDFGEYDAELYAP
jgi:hypothetical protein